MATPKAEPQADEELTDLNRRVAEEAAAKTTAEAKGLSASTKGSTAGESGAPKS